jgi:RNA-binding protein YlmH
MNRKIKLKDLLSARGRTLEQKSALFAWLSLGIVESLLKGLLTTEEAVSIFFNAENCLFVQRSLREENADEIMSRGVQLADLTEALPAKRAHQELQKELRRMRSLSLTILEQKKLAA